MRQSGSKLVLVLCTLAAVAAVVGWWSRYQATHRAAEFWGPETAALLRGPSQVEWIELAGWAPSKEEPVETVTWLAGQPVIARHDISTAQGLTHLRSALVEDRNFEWDRSAPGIDPDWAWALRFHAHDHATILLFPSDFSRLGYLEMGYLQMGKLQADSHTVVSISCRPLMVPLTTYFKSLEIALE
jgi:hypothetical protein